MSVLSLACAQKAVAPEDSLTPLAGTENVYIVSAGDVILNGRLFGALCDEDQTVRMYAASSILTVFRTLYPYRRLDLSALHPGCAHAA